MKLFLSAVLITFLTGCYTLPQSYDNNEYEMLVRFSVKTELMKEQCSNANEELFIKMFDRLREEIMVIERYTKYTPQNEEVYNVTKILLEDVDSQVNGTNIYNETYCNRKLDLIMKKTETLLEVIPKKKR